MSACIKKSWARCAALFALLALAGVIVLEQNLSQTLLDMAFAKAYSMGVETLNRAVKQVTENEWNTANWCTKRWMRRGG